jgi:Uma2 family endonuclease
MGSQLTHRPAAVRGNGYPTSDGRPIAETDLHRHLMLELIETLKERFAADPNTYVSGTILVFYEDGNKRRHVSPDVLVVRGIPKTRRDNYLIWEEGKAPDLVIELTSKTTRVEDMRGKSGLYRTVLRVPEYYLFDPRTEYLDPPFQGYRLRRGRYSAIKPVDGRLPSDVLGLHLERDGQELRFRDPVTGTRLPTPAEARAAAEVKRATAEAERAAVEADNERLRREIEELKRKMQGG